METMGLKIVASAMQHEASQNVLKHCPSKIEAEETITIKNVDNHFLFRNIVNIVKISLAHERK